ncbi:hypothetical protein F511_12711 [Dorcoceras hygrometricum]|uniref:Uncharacterized protein n=1 Tax=Dorcoceras hygrometricum TaxID=472368 RepID=A0A2Z7DF47_9LAMI|nr:hypothetical protein F511_12711 [Dorcoceras hygrometricum]
MPIDHKESYENINRANLHLIDLNLSLDEQIPKFSANRLSVPDWLPNNWKIDLKIRKSGKSAGAVDKEGFTRRFDLTPRVQTRSDNPQAARTPSRKYTPARRVSRCLPRVVPSNMNISLKLQACASAYTWAQDQLAHQLPPECANSRLCTALCFVLCIALYLVFTLLLYTHTSLPYLYRKPLI